MKRNVAKNRRERPNNKNKFSFQSYADIGNENDMNENREK